MQLTHRKNYRGDTIVEVLISIAIVGAVLTGAYALASHSLQEGISSAERTAATKIIEDQVEGLKFRYRNTNLSDPNNHWVDYFTTGTGSIPSSAQNFCLIDTSGTDASTISWRPIQNNGTTPDDLSSTNYNLSCIRISSNTTFYIDITSSVGQPNPTYQVSVRWLPPGATNQISKSQMYYRF